MIYLLLRAQFLAKEGTKMSLKNMLNFGLTYFPELLACQKGRLKN